MYYNYLVNLRIRFETSIFFSGHLTRPHARALTHLVHTTGAASMRGREREQESFCICECVGCIRKQGNAIVLC